MENQLEAHMQWTSLIFQNKILDIIAEVVLDSIGDNVKECSVNSIIVNEMSVWWVSLNMSHRPFSNDIGNIMFDGEKKISQTLKSYCYKMTM